MLGLNIVEFAGDDEALDERTGRGAVPPAGWPDMARAGGRDRLAALYRFDGY